MDNKIIFRVVVFSLAVALLLPFVLAQDSFSESYEGDELVDVTTVIAPELEPGTISVQNIDVVKEDGISTLTFQQTDHLLPNGAVEIGDNAFNNVGSVEGKESFLKLNSNGDIESADLYMSARGDTFILGEKEIYAPPKSRVVFDGENVHVYTGEDGRVRASFLEGSSGEVTFEGENMKIYEESGSGEYTSFSGKIHNDGQNFYIKSGEVYSQDGITLDAKERINFYFDGEAHSGNSLSLGEENFVFSCGENPDIGKLTLSGDSDYYSLSGVGAKEGWNDGTGISRLSNMNQRDLTVGFTEPDSSIDFFGEDNPLNEQIPSITTEGGYEIETGRLHLIAQDGKVRYRRNAGESVFSREVVINDLSNANYSRFIQVGQNSNMRFGISDADRDLVMGGEKDPMNNFNLKYFASSPEDFGTYEFGANDAMKKEFLEKRNYLTGAQEALNDELLRRVSDSEFASVLEEYGGEVPVYEIEEYVDEFADRNYYLDVETRDAVLEEAGYSDYTQVMESMREMVPYYETVGTDQDSPDLESQYYGVRQALLEYFVTEKSILESEEGQAAAEFANERVPHPVGRIDFVM